MLMKYLKYMKDQKADVLSFGFLKKWRTFGEEFILCIWTKFAAFIFSVQKACLMSEEAFTDQASTPLVRLDMEVGG